MDAASEEMHKDRGRAESFGAVAEQYERYRPAYPADLVADLLATDPRSVLDIGAGTGKASRLLVGPGRSLLAVESDPAMAAVARSLGIDVEVSAFETWSPHVRTFDLVVCAQAWHWVDPVAGAAKVAEVLAPGGVFACFWNYPMPHLVHDLTDGVQRQIAPACDFGVVDVRSSDDPYVAQLRDSGQFAEVTRRRYAWTETLTAAEWVGRIGTRSDYLRLPPEQRRDLLDGVLAAVAPYEPLVLPFGTYAIVATARS